MNDRDDGYSAPPTRILVATDFSPASAVARDYALALAAPEARVCFLHTTVLPIPEAEPQPEWMPPEPDARGELMALLERFAAPARQRGFAVQAYLEDGLPSETILRMVRVTQADLVALGTHGRRGIERWIQGSTAQRVLRYSPVPVLTASSVGTHLPRSLRRIVCAAGTTESAATIAYACRLAQAKGAALTCLHVVEPPPGAGLGLAGDLEAYYVAEELRARARIGAALGVSGGERSELVIAAGEARHEILRAAAVASADLIVMGARDVRPAEAGFFGSTVERIVRDAFCPVLTLRHAVVDSTAVRESHGELITAR